MAGITRPFFLGRPVKASDVLRDHERAVVIVRYRKQADYHGGHPPHNPACLLQVSMLTTNISPSGKLIRLGNTKGDEIVGWTPLDYLEVIEILGQLADDGKTVTPIVPREATELSA